MDAIEDIRVEIVNGPHKGDIITLNYMVPSIRLAVHTYNIKDGVIVYEYKIQRVLREDGSLKKYIGVY